MVVATGSVAYTQLHNMALNSNLPTVVLIALKNGNLVTNMLAGAILLGRRYSWKQHIALISVSVGLTLCSLSGGTNTTSTDGSSGGATIGAVCLAIAMLSRAI